jgi:hypothetical protein
VSTLPPRARLAQVVTSLARRLPGQLPALLDAERFADGATALHRLADPTYLAAATAATGPDEAAWLAELLTARWAAVGTVELDPVAALLGPDTAPRGERIRLVAVADGVDDGWSVSWPVGVTPDPDDARVGLVTVEQGTAVTARVIARSAAGRHVLTATWTAAIGLP